MREPLGPVIRNRLQEEKWNLPIASPATIARWKRQTEEKVAAIEKTTFHDPFAPGGHYHGLAEVKNGQVELLDQPKTPSPQSKNVPVFDLKARKAYIQIWEEENEETMSDDLISFVLNELQVGVYTTKHEFMIPGVPAFYYYFSGTDWRLYSDSNFQRSTGNRGSHFVATALVNCEYSDSASEAIKRLLDQPCSRNVNKPQDIPLNSPI